MTRKLSAGLVVEGHTIGELSRLLKSFLGCRSDGLQWSLQMDNKVLCGSLQAENHGDQLYDRHNRFVFRAKLTAIIIYSRVQIRHHFAAAQKGPEIPGDGPFPSRKIPG